MRKIFLTIAALLLVAALGVFLYYQDNSLKVTDINYVSKTLPKGFSGYKVVQISDLQNKRFGKNQEKLLNKVKQLKPDVIFVTGDLIDRRSSDINNASDLIDGFVKICKVYYVPGNHEADSDLYEDLRNYLIRKGVYVLENEHMLLENNKDYIEIIGVDDPTVTTRSRQSDSDKKFMRNELKKFEKHDFFSIMLSHRPEYFELYVQTNVNLVFSGHAHGGQIRLPFIGGLYAPNQGIFPKYTGGAYNEGETTMIVSRGLGNSIFPFRVFNRPDIVKVTLGNGQEKQA